MHGAAGFTRGALFRAHAKEAAAFRPPPRRVAVVGARGKAPRPGGGAGGPSLDDSVSSSPEVAVPSEEEPSGPLSVPEDSAGGWLSACDSAGATLSAGWDSAG